MRNFFFVVRTAPASSRSLCECLLVGRNLYFLLERLFMAAAVAARMMGPWASMVFARSALAAPSGSVIEYVVEVDLSGLGASSTGRK